MPRITAIKQQKRSGGRFSVFADDVYVFALDGLELGQSGLRVGQDLTDDDLARYKADGEAGKAYAAAIRQLSVRCRSRHEVEVYLRRKAYDADLAASIVDRLTEAGLINDAAFAQAWVSDRQLLRPRSRRALAAELAAKGVDRAAAAEALMAVTPEAELATVIEIANSKRRLAQYHDIDKLTGYLGRQGFSYEVIKKALARLDDN